MPPPIDLGLVTTVDGERYSQYFSSTFKKLKVYIFVSGLSFGSTFFVWIYVLCFGFSGTVTAKRLPSTRYQACSEFE